MISDEKTIRIATMALFMKALILDLYDGEKRVHKSVDAIVSRISKFIRKRFNTPNLELELSNIVNQSWNSAIKIKIEMSVSFYCMEMFDSQYREDFENIVKIRAKDIGSFHNIWRDTCTLKDKMGSKKAVKHSISCINKVIYDYTHQ